MTKFSDHRMSIAVEILLIKIFDKAAIFAQVIFEPYLGVCYGAYSRSSCGVLKE